MSYIKFMLKKLTANKYNIIILCVLLLLVGTFLHFNISAKSHVGHLERLKIGLDEKKGYLAQHQIELQTKIEGTEEYSILKENIELSNQLITEDETNIQLYSQGKWAESYHYELERMKMDRRIVSNQQQHYGDDLLTAIEKRILLFEYLQEKNLEKDSEKAVQGINFTVEYWHYALSVSVTFLFIFLLSNLYTDKFKDHIDISLVYPFRKHIIMVKDIGLGFLVTFSLFAFNLVIAFVVSSLISGTGSFEYPFNLFNSDGTVSFVRIGDIITPAFVMQMMVFAVCVVFVYAVSIFIKNKLTALLISLIAILGSFLVVNIAVPFQQIAQYIPFTYLNAVGVVSGEYGHAVQNYAVNFNFGMLVLTTYLVVFLGIILISISQFSLKKV